MDYDSILAVVNACPKCGRATMPTGETLNTEGACSIVGCDGSGVSYEYVKMEHFIRRIIDIANDHSMFFPALELGSRAED